MDWAAAMPIAKGVCMSSFIKGLLTIVAGAALAAALAVLVNFAFGSPPLFYWAALGAALFGLAYGLQTGIYGIYPLTVLL